MVNKCLLSARSYSAKISSVQSLNTWVVQIVPNDRRGKWGLDLRQLGSTDKRVGLLQKSPSGTFVVIRTVVRLCVAVRGTEVMTTSERFE